MPQGDNAYKVYLFFPSKTDARGKVTFAGYANEILLKWNADGFAISSTDIQ